MKKQRNAGRESSARRTIGSIWAVLGAMLLFGGVLSQPAAAIWGKGHPPPEMISGPPVEKPVSPGLPERASAPPAGLQYHQITATIPLTPGIGQGPEAIATDPNSPLVYVANQGSWDITVLSGTEALGMVAGVAQGEDMAYAEIGVHPSSGLLYAVGRAGDRCSADRMDLWMQVISATQVIKTIQLEHCLTHHGGGCWVSDLTFQDSNGYLYLLGGHSTGVQPPEGWIDVFAGTEPITRISIPGVVLRSIVTDPQQGWVYLSPDPQYADAVYVLSGTALVGTVPVTKPGLLEVQPNTGLAYVQSGGDHLAILRGTAGLGDVWVGEIAAMAADPTGDYLYLSHPATPTVTILSGTAVLTEVVVVSPGGRLEVNPATGLIYLRHPGASLVTVLSGTAVLTQVEVTGGDAAIAAAPFTGLVYAVAGENSVAVLQGTSPLTHLRPAFGRPQAMKRHPQSGQIVLLSTPPALSFIQDDRIVATTPLTSAPEDVLIHPDSGLIYLTLPDEHAVLVMSGTTPLATVPVSDFPRDIALQPKAGLLYVASHSGNLDVLSGTERIATLPLGEELAHIAADPRRGLVYVTDLGSATVHVLSGTEVMTDIQLAFSDPGAIALEPGSGYAYVGGSNPSLWVISATTVLSEIHLNGWGVSDIQASPTSGYLYLQLRPYSPGSPCERIEVIRGLQQVASWFSYADEKRFSCLEAHPLLSYVYAGQAIPGGYLSIGMGPTLAETLTVGDGSWVRAIAVDPAGERLYAATDHAITILEIKLPYRFYLPLLWKGGTEGNL